MTELASLIESMCQGTATHADRDRLEKLLRDPANRAEYLAATRLHSELLWRWHRGRIDVVRPTRGRQVSGHQASGHAARSTAATSALTGVRHRFAAAVATARDVTVGWVRFLTRPAPFACLVAASVLGAFLVTAGILSIGQAGDPTFAAAASQARPIVARVTGLHAVRWPSPRDAWHDWDALPKGSRIEVTAGLVQVTHLDGANVVIEGPASYQVLSPTSGRLIRGRLAARTEHDKPTAPADRSAPAVPDDTPLFTVITPQRLVHDLGTEFGVEVQEFGDTGVHVFEGLVELAAVDRATAKNEVPVRLGAGESAGIDEAGRIGSGGRSLARAFVRSLPKVEGKPEKSFLDQIGWNDSTAEVIYRETFAGDGPIAGTSPASRGGVGNAAWVAPGAWAISPSHGSLVAAGSGTALLPFQPEAGWLYRIAIDFDVFAGGHDWFAMGLAPAMDAGQLVNDVPGVQAWMGQRNETRHTESGGNFAFRGPGQEGLVMPIDFATGRQRRSILLDARGRTWRAYFLLGDQPVATCSYTMSPTAIANIALSQYNSAQTSVHGFSVARVATPATPPPPDTFEEKSR